MRGTLAHARQVWRNVARFPVNIGTAHYLPFFLWINDVADASVVAPAFLPSHQRATNPTRVSLSRTSDWDCRLGYPAPTAIVRTRRADRARWRVPNRDRLLWLDETGPSQVLFWHESCAPALWPRTCDALGVG